MDVWRVSWHAWKVDLRLSWIWYEVTNMCRIFLFQSKINSCGVGEETLSQPGGRGVSTKLFSCIERDCHHYNALLCLQVQAKAGGATPLGNCTLSEISNMCLNFDLYQMVLGLLRDVDSYISDQRFVIPESANDWINTNLNGDSESVPKSAVDLILEMYGCSLTSSGSYTCTEDWGRRREGNINGNDSLIFTGISTFSPELTSLIIDRHISALTILSLIIITHVQWTSKSCATIYNELIMLRMIELKKET